MSDIKKWGSDDEQKFTDTSKGKLTYDGDKNPEISIDHIEGKLSMFKAAPDMYKALEYVISRIETMDEAWWIENENCGGFDMDKIETALKKARGEYHE